MWGKSTLPTLGSSVVLSAFHTRCTGFLTLRAHRQGARPDWHNRRDGSNPLCPSAQDFEVTADKGFGAGKGGYELAALLDWFLLGCLGELET